MEATKNIPWRKFALTTVAVSGILLTAWLGLEIAYAADFDSTRRAAYLHIAGQIKGFALGVVEFAKPFVQVAFALLILHWLLRRFAPDLDLSKYNWRELNVEKLLIAVVTIGFVVVSIRVGFDSLPHIKEVMLVVLGLYFGMMRRE
jgi:hypothetical protein